VDDLKPSKSARKREYLALQKLGEELISLKESDLASLPLDENLLEAVLEARQIKAHGAMRRQKQYIGKLMRHIDPEPLRIEMAKLRR
jgi:ribosome-associated protein